MGKKASPSNAAATIRLEELSVDARDEVQVLTTQQYRWLVEVPEGLPVETGEHRLPEDQRQCPVCGGEMVEIGKEIHRSLKIRQLEFSIQEDVYYKYACKFCETESGEAFIVKSPKEPVVIPGSFAFPEAIAHIMTQKFVMYSPLYRQEQK